MNLDKVKLNNFVSLGIRDGRLEHSSPRPPSTSSEAIVAGGLRDLESEIKDTVAEIMAQDGSRGDLDPKDGRVVLSQGWKGSGGKQVTVEGEAGIVLDFEHSTKTPIKLERTVLANVRDHRTSVEPLTDLVASSQWVWSADGTVTILENRNLKPGWDRAGHEETFWAEFSGSQASFQQDRVYKPGFYSAGP
jgi:hypothetical protein